MGKRWEYGWKWRTGETARQKRVGIEPPCNGSPNCAGAIHVEPLLDGMYAGGGTEIHLTPDEIRWVRKWLKRALKEHRLQRKEANAHTQ